MSSQSTAILYIDDRAVSRRAMQLMVEEVLGYELVLLDTTDRIIEVLEAINTDFNVIFLDLHMAPHDGLSTHRMLRQHERFGSAMIVALTANITGQEVADLKMAGFDGLLLKPVTLDRFPQQIGRLLEGDPVWEMS